MNGQFFPELNERINDETHKRLIREAENARQARKAVKRFRLFGKKDKTVKEEKKEWTVDVPGGQRKPSPNLSA